MKKYSKFLVFIWSVLIILSVAGNKQLQAAQEKTEKSSYACGLAMTTYDNGGKAYENWWTDSELNVYVKNIPVQITKGTCEITAYVPGETLKSGSYILEAYLEVNNNQYSGQNTNFASFSINGGELKSDDTGCSYQEISNGYLITFKMGYDLKKATKEYQVVLKLHSDNTGENGNVYFVDMTFADEKVGTTEVAFSDDKLNVEAKKYLGDEKITVTKVKGSGIKIMNETGLLSEGDVLKLQLKGNAALKDMVCKSSDEAVAVILADGTITAKKAGTTTITITNTKNKDSYSWTLTVLKKDIPKLFSYGLAVTPYSNGGTAYSDWWNESEICAYVENIRLGIIRGGYGVSAFIPDYTLKDGTYGIEVSLCKNRSPYDYFSYTGCEITIKNGVFEESSCTGVFRRTDGGYLVDMASGYVLDKIVGDYVFVVKVHSSVPGENGCIYFGDLFFADASSGFNYVDLSNTELVMSAERLQNYEPLNVSVQALSNELTVENLNALMYKGEKQKLNIKSNAESMKLTYQSSDEKVASVSADGTVTAKAAGEVTVSIKDSISGAECSARITVKEPYVAPQIEKKAVLVKSTYQYVGEGYGVENPNFTWSSSDKTVGTIDAKSGLFKALKEGKTTITMKDQKSGKSYAFEVEVYNVTNNELEKYITIETNGLISAELEQKITKLLYEVYPEVFDYFADGKYDKVSCTFMEMDGVAYTTGDREMYISAAYINANPEDVDCVTHELIHCAQAYPGGDVWLIEGITDYGRSIIGLYNKEANWSLNTYAGGQSYTDSYGVTGGFLKYVVENHNKNMVSILNQGLKKGSYSESVWKESTGYTIDELWELYSKH